MGKPSRYDTGGLHEFMTAIKNAVVDLGGDDTDLKRIHTDPELARAVAAVIVHINRTEPRDLMDVIRYAPNPEVRLRALSCLGDIAEHQAFLQRVVYDDTNPRVRLAAAKLIVVEPLLVEIAMCTKDLSVGLEVVGRITDHNDLIRIALKNPTHIPLYETVNRLLGAPELNDFVMKCENVEHALLALRMVTDTAALLDIGENARIQAVREQARHRCAGRV